MQDSIRFVQKSDITVCAALMFVNTSEGEAGSERGVGGHMKCGWCFGVPVTFTVQFQLTELLTFITNPTFSQQKWIKPTSLWCYTPKAT